MRSEPSEPSPGEAVGLVEPRPVNTSRRVSMMPNPISRTRPIRRVPVRVRGGVLGVRDFFLIAAAVAVGIVIGGSILLALGSADGSSSEDGTPLVIRP